GRRGLGARARLPVLRGGRRALADGVLAPAARGRQRRGAEQGAARGEVVDRLGLREAEAHQHPHRAHGRRGRRVREGLPRSARARGREAAPGPGRGDGLTSARVLVAEPLSESGLALLQSAGLGADVKTDLTREALLAAIAEYDGLVVRSATQVNKELL